LSVTAELPKSGFPHATFRDLLQELREFQAVWAETKRRIEALPEPLGALLILPLRNAEDLRHGTDHLIHALKNQDRPEFFEDQIRDARSHLMNLIPDIYMHVNGALLRWSDDALLEMGLAKAAEKRRIEELIRAFGKTRLTRTGDRVASIREAKRIFGELMDLAPQILALTENKRKEGEREIAELQTSGGTLRRRFLVSLLLFIGGLVLHAW
jgi:hypothetical protein